MNIRLASVAAAVVLSLSAVASPVLAQSYTAPAGVSAHAAPGYTTGRALDDELTTGSIAPRRDDASAKEGNAEQNSFPVWQYGRTSGGTR
ncbi:hypothetical protein ASF27_12310 [Methylobacterium sp. Leaf102]|uniref:hypothetical protein n=1 Tax=Methylobacterium sp. Leaf102 TaxID=1736253 RepID=UPI0006F928AB|nr:hypothetical protein [Methylobacterium sp. Leaf102]KQP23942.1 hypothetical protein ASF27_12310 [Methylobacterium sp. Leaf102]USU31315.1 hypothetical protein NG677_18545 [Methylobacterium sp. OTU13CASTA1]